MVWELVRNADSQKKKKRKCRFSGPTPVYQIRISGGEAQILTAFSFIPADSNVKPRLRILQDSSSVANLPEEADQRI